MKTREQMEAEGMSNEDIEKAMTEQGLDAETLSKALDGLDALTKSEDDDLDEMIKSLDAAEALLKSDDGDEDDEKEEEDDDEDEGCDKSMSDDEPQDELVKASEAYAELEDTIHKSMGNIDLRLRTMEKSMMASMNLQIKMAKALAGMSDNISKSMESDGAAPAAHRPGFFGKGAAPESDTLKKSENEIGSILTELVQKGQVEPKYLSVFAVKTSSALPDFVKAQIGI